MVHPVIQEELDIISILSRRAFQIERHPESGGICIDVAFASRTAAGMALADLIGHNLEISSYFWTLDTFHMPDIIEYLFALSTDFGPEYFTLIGNMVTVITEVQKEGLPEVQTAEITDFLKRAKGRRKASTNICLHITSSRETGIHLDGVGEAINSFDAFSVKVPKALLALSDVGSGIRRLTKYMRSKRCTFEQGVLLYRLYKSLCLICEVRAGIMPQSNRVKTAEELLLT